jgi:hypothetical protein
MPSRPVLIGRGLTTQHTTNTHQAHNGPHGYTNKQHTNTTPASTTQTQPTHPPPTNQTHTPQQKNQKPTNNTSWNKSYGGHSDRETPGTIPNPEVKPASANGTATTRLWESRTPPNKHHRVTPKAIQVAGVALSLSHNPP